MNIYFAPPDTVRHLVKTGREDRQRLARFMSLGDKQTGAAPTLLLLRRDERMDGQDQQPGRTCGAGFCN